MLYSEGIKDLTYASGVIEEVKCPSTSEMIPSVLLQPCAELHDKEVDRFEEMVSNFSGHHENQNRAVNKLFDWLVANEAIPEYLRFCIKQEENLLLECWYANFDQIFLAL
ncbi:hypothetical protein EB796_008383 [Bugula neritina]|uniref:Uncharacterized protein n=1 Tax=Bugula neritina TaxID=10212 RepID=A0A7J7K3V5_BUGNE|nr:hypothetical protein EB796_008383 [Bugula neritina]